MTDYEGQLRRANELLGLGRAEQAAALLVALLHAFPEEVGHTQLALAVAHSRAGRPTAALESAREAVALLPDAAAAHHVLGSVLRTNGRTKEALASLDRAAHLAPHDAQTHQQRAQVLSDLRRRNEAFGAASEGVRLAPEDPDTHFSMGYVLHDSNRTEAVRAYRAALALDPQHAHAMHNLAALRVGAGDYADGARGFADTLATAPQARLAVTMLDQVLVLAIRRLHFTLFLGAWGMGVAGAMGAGLGIGWLPLPVFATLCAVLFMVGRRGVAPLRGALPHRGDGFLRGFAKRERIATTWLVLLAFAWLALAIGTLAALVGPEPEALFAWVGPAIVLLFVGVALSWLRVPLLHRRVQRDRLL